EDDEGHEIELRIVGPDEIDPARRYVSMDSPLARALMRRQRDEEFTVEVPGGRKTYVVTEIRYEAGDDGS
ncbi:MAG TPA: GreA/GreB family elongation factor, partial [Steroidobacteraceae bacterium]|nr:GreA/GreB family elongation factor [Steroidobacteraceae bacterium]